jgi:hypothetical protein
MAGLNNDPSEKQPRRYLSPQDFSQLSGLSLASVYRYLKSGQLPCWQPRGPRGRILIPADALVMAHAGRPDAPTSLTSTLAAPSPATAAPQCQTAPQLSGPRPKWLLSSPPSEPLPEN